MLDSSQKKIASLIDCISVIESLDGGHSATKLNAVLEENQNLLILYLLNNYLQIEFEPELRDFAINATPWTLSIYKSHEQFILQTHFVFQQSLTSLCEYNQMKFNMYILVISYSVLILRKRTLPLINLEIFEHYFYHLEFQKYLFVTNNIKSNSLAAFAVFVKVLKANSFITKSGNTQSL